MICDRTVFPEDVSRLYIVWACLTTSKGFLFIPFRGEGMISGVYRVRPARELDLRGSRRKIALVLINNGTFSSSLFCVLQTRVGDGFLEFSFSLSLDVFVCVSATILFAE